MKHPGIRKRGTFLWMTTLMVALAVRVCADGVRLPSVLSDHMVLQRGVSVPVWGWVEPPETQVLVSFKGQTVSTKADDAGYWRIDLGPLAADSEPFSMTVAGGGQTVTVKDILVGEVWLCSGQSNMEWPVRRFANAEQEIDRANWPQIRLIKAARSPQLMPQKDNDAEWTVCSPQTAGDYTAVGYYFARKLHQELNVPVGLLSCSWGGTRIEPWIPLEGYAALPEFKGMYQKILYKNPNNEMYRSEAERYLEAMKMWLERGLHQFQSGAALSEPPGFPDLIRPYSTHQDPTMLYNGMIAPFVPFSIRGALWYQGESNHSEGMRYLDKTRALVEGWRTVWGNPELPYYFVQIAPYHYDLEDAHILPEFWEAQAAIPGKIPHTGMVVVGDIGDSSNIHPPNKQDVGVRLANMALKRNYGRSDLMDCGPRFREMRVTGSKLLLTFDHVGKGLASRDGRPINAFELTGTPPGWIPAGVRIIAPDTLELSAPGIDIPAAVRFAWHKQAEWNLMNSAGLPAEPFRAGEVPAASNIVARWTFDDDSCTDEIAGLKGQLYNNPADIRVADGILKLDNRGNGDRDGAVFLVPDSPRLTGHGEGGEGYTSLVVEVDVQPEALGDQMQILRKTDGETGYQLYIRGDGYVVFHIKTAKGASQIVSKNRIAADGVWTHLEAVWDGSLTGYNCYLTVDGVVTWGIRDLGALANTTSPLAVGGIYRAEKNIGQRFSGSIDNLVISVDRPELIRSKLVPESTGKY